MKIPFFGIKSSDSDQIFLSQNESHHCIKVLRYKNGDKIQVLDGKGNLYNCIIFNDSLNQCILNIDDVDFKKPKDYSLHIIISPPKNADRIDWLIEKSVEMGTNRISFIQSDRSIRKRIKFDRLERISIAAMKQSYSRYKLKIDEIMPLSDIFTQIKAKQCFIPHLEKGKRILIHNAFKPKQDTCILIGPEGDFTPDEISNAINQGFQPISLGEQRLRTETAAIMTIGAFNYINEY